MVLFLRPVGIFRYIKRNILKWKSEFETNVDFALLNSKPSPQNPKLRMPADIKGKILSGSTQNFMVFKKYHKI